MGSHVYDCGDYGVRDGDYGMFVSVIDDGERCISCDKSTSNNDMIDWEGVRLLAKEPGWKKRQVKEAIFIRKGRAQSTGTGGATFFQKFSRRCCATIPSPVVHS